ncbi:MAG TPA: C-terminal binding protein [Kribbella sp.]|uniref:C-terminal binding protein n=1 Tax=Kribbella sp. TaxID=1871183 RepID=UPI002D77F074|nr:C-terminal binding protein [Kribbella sp.]HET6297512.1 C-terminal binding protein [Kribbella sp.]
MKVLLTDQAFPDTDLERGLLAEAGHTLIVAPSADDVQRLAPEADAILNALAPIGEDLIKKMTKARIIARYGIGIDNIDVDAAANNGIIVTNVPDYCVEEVASHAVAMALMLLRNLSKADEAARSGLWGVGSVRPLRRISTLTVGLLGFGRIGKLVATSMASFGTGILVHDPYAKKIPEPFQAVGLNDLLTRSDILFLHAPLTPETRGIINAETLAQLPSGAIVINAARGPLIVLHDLVASLRAGRLKGAALDTFPVEPLDPTLVADVPNLLLSPHTAFYSEEAMRESQVKATQQVIKVLAGEPADYPIRAVTSS